MRKTRQARVKRALGARRVVFAVAPFGLLLLFAAPPADRLTERQKRNLPVKPPIRYAEPTAPHPLPAHAVYLALERGDTLDQIFRLGGLSSHEAASLALEFGRHFDPRTLQPGQLVRFERSESDSVNKVDLFITAWGEVRANRGRFGQFRVEAVAATEHWAEAIITGEVEGSLYRSVAAAGELPQLVPQLVDIFQWDVDFFSLNKGDRFTVVVDRRFMGNDHVGYGPVRAARFEFQGRVYEAFRFDRGDGAPGYFTRHGMPLRKQFLKAPLKFTRITSGFSHRRFHPILQRFRPHYGIDYGAPVGTPVLATAEGVVVDAGYDRGEGKHVRIRHSSRIQTGYLHLARFAKGIAKGTRVRQGDVIGYVGMTGLTTGPHLDYRVIRDGKPINPLSLRSITPDPLMGAALRRFKLVLGRDLPKLQAEQEMLASVESEGAPPALF